jgi:hypothetical protein
MDPLRHLSFQHQPCCLTAFNTTGTEIEAVLQLQLLLAQQLNDTTPCFELSGSLTNTVNWEVVIVE